MKNFFYTFLIFQPIVFLTCALLVYCEPVDTGLDSENSSTIKDSQLSLSLEDVATLLAEIPLEKDQMNEVYDAVKASLNNGYDEEYTMRNLFAVPGSGVGDDIETKAESSSYAKPLRDLIVEYSKLKSSTKSSSDSFVDSLSSSDIQIYWPYSENWDGKQDPIITYAPSYDTDKNVGYLRKVGSDGNVVLEECIVDEETAMSRPVWVVNQNDDAGYKTLEMLRKDDPDWGMGGSVVVKSNDDSSWDVKSLMIKNFCAKRNYDPWFAGASEFFVKCGAIENFKATTEKELLEYNPLVTDFLVVVKRNQIGKTIPYNVVLVSEWTDQLESCAFMVTEDDGGTLQTWSCSANVKIKSKTYGFDISIPFNKRDDIVWRGQLTRRYFEKNESVAGRFGDVVITFEIK